MQVEFLLSISFKQPSAKLIKLLFSVEMWGNRQTKEHQYLEAGDIPNRGGYDRESGSGKPNQEFKVGVVTAESC